MDATYQSTHPQIFISVSHPFSIRTHSLPGAMDKDFCGLIDIKSQRVCRLSFAVRLANMKSSP
jgi:hypothetical protein